MATWDMNLNIEPGCFRTTDSDMALESSLGLDVSLDPGKNQTTHISLLPNTFTYSALLLSKL